MAADRQRLTLRGELAAAWCRSLPAAPPGTAAWVGRIDEIAAPLLGPTASDLADAGRRSGEMRRLFLARRSALRHLIARRLGAEAQAVEIGYDPGGAPRVLAPRDGGFVSVSARGPWAALAVAPRPVGIDIEPLDPEGEVAWALLTSAERWRIEASPQSRRAAAFLQHWTAKEAYLKALGAGLSREPAEVEVGWQDAGSFAICDAGQSVAGEGANISFEAGMHTIIAAIFCRAT